MKFNPSEKLQELWKYIILQSAITEPIKLSDGTVSHKKHNWKGRPRCPYAAEKFS